MDKYLEVELELETTEHCDEDEVFYRYRIGKYQFWFTQHQDNGKKTKSQNCIGCIFGVHTQCDDNSCFPLRIYSKIGSNLGYPNEFFIDQLPYTLPVDDFDEFKDKLYYAQECLCKIRKFLYNGKHYELFKKRETLK